MRACVEEEAWILGASRALKTQRACENKAPRNASGKSRQHANGQRSHQLQKGGTDADLADHRKPDEAEDRGD
jgi:hypothetical protein